MKSYLFSINLSLLLILVASFSFAQTSKDIKFEETTKKFKRTNEGEIVSFNYVFTYYGKVELSILSPGVDCSCTSVNLPEGKIQPNSSNTIEVIFNTADKIGWQEREVVLHFTSDLKDSLLIEKKLTFKGPVKATKTTKKSFKLNKTNN